MLWTGTRIIKKAYLKSESIFLVIKKTKNTSTQLSEMDPAVALCPSMPG